MPAKVRFLTAGIGISGETAWNRNPVRISLAGSGMILETLSEAERNPPDHFFAHTINAPLDGEQRVLLFFPLWISEVSRPGLCRQGPALKLPRRRLPPPPSGPPPTRALLHTAPASGFHLVHCLLTAAKKSLLDTLPSRPPSPLVPRNLLSCSLLRPSNDYNNATVACQPSQYLLRVLVCTSGAVNPRSGKL